MRQMQVRTAEAERLFNVSHCLLLTAWNDPTDTSDASLILLPHACAMERSSRPLS